MKTILSIDLQLGSVFRVDELIDFGRTKSGLRRVVKLKAFEWYIQFILFDLQMSRLIMIMISSTALVIREQVKG